MSGRVVIAGGTGFLGRNLAAHLTDSGWNVLVLSRSEIREEVFRQLFDWMGVSVRA